MAAPPKAEWTKTPDGLRVALAGAWTTEGLDATGWPQSLPPESTGQQVIVDFRGLETLDSNAALALHRWIARIRERAAGQRGFDR